MLKFYGQQPPAPYHLLNLGGVCPHCKTGTRFSRTSHPDVQQLQASGIQHFVLSYACDACLGPIPVQWRIHGWGNNLCNVAEPKLALAVREPFDFEHVPEVVRKEIGEALDCLSVGSPNGFAAMCRRAIQTMCTNLGAGASTRIKAQIEEMAQISELDEEWKGLAMQVMLTGHDGAHPHLPEVGPERAAMLLSLLRDLVYQLYTRPGKVKAAASLRKKKVEENKPT
jgi:hypothetical protein